MRTLVWAILFTLAACRAEPPEDPQQRQRLQLPQLSVELPAGWRPETPSSEMRTAQVRVPGGEEGAELAVFHFGEGRGGTVADNVRRWVAEIEFAPGSSVHREEFAAFGYTIYMVDFEGTLRAGMKDGGAIQRRPAWRVLGGIVEGPGGPWYFKLTGPSAVLAPQRDAFLRMLESVRPEEES